MTKILHFIHTMRLIATMAIFVGFGSMAINAGATLIIDNAAHAQQGGNVPGNALGSMSDAQMWRAIKGGIRGDVSIPDLSLIHI